VSNRFFVVKEHPKKWADSRNICSPVVTIAPWEHSLFTVSSVSIKGRKAWGAKEAIWANEVIYYNTLQAPLSSILQKIVIHHTNNSNSIQVNEAKQQNRGYAALGYHFFIDQAGNIYEGRPLEVMGSHAGVGKKSGPLSDPDWGAIGIVLQGDYHHADDWVWNSKTPKIQLDKLEKLINALKTKYSITKLIMHREVTPGHTVCPGDSLVPHVQALRTKLNMSR